MLKEVVCAIINIEWREIGADFVNSNLTILGAFESGIKTDVAEQFVQKFLEKYENVEGELYLGYPIYIDWWNLLVSESSHWLSNLWYI